MMIKHEGKMVPAKLVNGKYVPDLNAELHITKDGMEVASIGAKPSTVDLGPDKEDEE